MQMAKLHSLVIFTLKPRKDKFLMLEGTRMVSIPTRSTSAAVCFSELILSPTRRRKAIQRMSRAWLSCFSTHPLIIFRSPTSNSTQTHQARILASRLRAWLLDSGTITPKIVRATASRLLMLSAHRTRKYQICTILCSHVANIAIRYSQSTTFR